MKLIIASTAAFLMAGAAQAQTEIGVTMTAFDNPFLTVLLNGMRGEAERREGVELIEENANLDVGRQLNQVQNFIASGVDAIIARSTAIPPSRSPRWSRPPACPSSTSTTRRST